MRKEICLFVIIVFLGLNLSAQENLYTENWFSVGFEYGNFFESVSSSGNEAETYMVSPGINLSGYTFWNGGMIGLFLNDSFLFPSKTQATINGTSYTSDLEAYDFLMQVGLVIGPAYRRSFTNNVIFRTGVGFSAFELAGNTSEAGILAFNLGLGGDIGFKFDLTDSFYIDFGSKVGYDFWNWTRISTAYGSTSGTASNYSMWRFNPYVSIGFNSINLRSGLGKPKS